MLLNGVDTGFDTAMRPVSVTQGLLNRLNPPTARVSTSLLTVCGAVAPQDNPLERASRARRRVRAGLAELPSLAIGGRQQRCREDGALAPASLQRRRVPGLRPAPLPARRHGALDGRVGRPARGVLRAGRTRPAADGRRLGLNASVRGGGRKLPSNYFRDYGGCYFST